MPDCTSNDPNVPTQSRGRHPLRAHAFLLAPLVALVELAGCASMPSAPILAVGRDLAFTGTVVTADFAPWAFDGSAVVTVDAGPLGRIAVSLPARYNLCKASGIGSASTLAAGMKVDIVGRVTAPAQVSVCESASHHITRLP